MSKYNIKELVANTDFEAQRKDTTLKEWQFNFDLDKMKEAMSQEGIRMPHFKNFEEFEEWLDRSDDE